VGLADGCHRTLDGGLGIASRLVAHALVPATRRWELLRNIQRYLAKRWWQETHRRFQEALEQKSYADAKWMLKDFEQWWTFAPRLR